MERRAGFMDLPGEIRNEIYELVVLNMQKEYDMLKLVHLPQTKFLPQVSGCRGLTQLCQQARQEFLPFWQQRHVYVEIDIRDIARFVDTFYDFKDTRAMADANGSIEVSLDRGTSDRDAPDYVDLLPFLRLMILAPRLQSRFVAMNYIQRDGPPKYISDLVTIFRLAKVQKDELRYHFLCTLSRIILKPLPSPSPYAPPPSLNLHISPEFSCYDLTFRNKLLYETGFVGLRTLELLIIFGSGNYCEDLKRVDYLNSDRLQFDMYANSGQGLPRRRKRSLENQFGDIDGRDNKKDLDKIRQAVMGQPKSNVQPKSNRQEKAGGQRNNSGLQNNGVRDRVRSWLQKLDMRRKKRNGTVMSS